MPLTPQPLRPCRLQLFQSKKHGKYAQYLVIFCDGNFRNTVGVWKRYSDFSELSRKVSTGHSECRAAVTGLNPLSVTDDEHDVEVLPNAMTSWCVAHDGPHPLALQFLQSLSSCNCH